MKYYTEEQLLKAVAYGRRVQKKEDYKTAEDHLIGSVATKISIQATLNDLYSDQLIGKITIKEIDEHLKESEPRQEAELRWIDIK